MNLSLELDQKVLGSLDLSNHGKGAKVQVVAALNRKILEVGEEAKANVVACLNQKVLEMG